MGRLLAVAAEGDDCRLVFFVGELLYLFLKL
jgi:hypothetical protein